MTDSDKIALHYKVIADMAHKVEKVSKRTFCIIHRFYL